MYFADLSETDHGSCSSDWRRLNVGWLEKGHAFAKGRVQPEFVAALRRLVAKPVCLTRGCHQCEFCQGNSAATTDGGQGNPAHVEILGNGEIHVAGEQGIVYVAPVLIRHYVEAHGYLPPGPFIRACLGGILRSPPYTKTAALLKLPPEVVKPVAAD